MNDVPFRFRECLSADLRANQGNPKGTFIVLAYRITSFFSRKRRNPLLWPISFPIRVTYKLLVEWILGAEIPASTQIGKGLKIHHGQGLVVNSKARIGNYVTLKHNTTIGASTDLNDRTIAAPTIEDSVIVHPHSIIIGDIVIGHNSIIGAGSVILKDVPPYSIAAGNPGRVIRTLARPP